MARASRTSTTVTVSGPIFESDVIAIVQRQTRMWIEHRVELAKEFATEEMQPGHGYLTGHFHDTIVGKSGDTSGVVKSDSSVQIRTWLERGTRRGVKLRKGYLFFAHAGQKVNRLPTSDLGEAIAAALQ